MVASAGVSSMVFIITGAAVSDRNALGRLLADSLGWELVDDDELHPLDLDARNRSAFLAYADPSFPIETLSASIQHWIYTWQDIVVSCPTLTETARRQLSGISPLVKVVCLDASHATTGLPLPDSDRSLRAIGSEFPDRGLANEPAQEAFTVNLSRQVEEIIRKMVSRPKCSM